MDSDIQMNDLWGLNDRGSAPSSEHIPAFFNIEDLDDDEEIAKWMETAIPILQSQAKDYARRAVENLMFFKGVSPDPTRDYSNFYDVNRYVQQTDVSFNIVYEFVELWVNRAGTYKADITCSPATNDPEARDHAEAKKLALQDFFHKNKVNQLLTRFDRHNFTLGEAYLHCYWDKDRGPLHPEFPQIEKRYKALKRVRSADGKEVNINRLPRIGDVAVELVPSINVLFEDMPWEDLDYIILEIPANADKLRSDYEDKEIKGDGNISSFWLYHLPTKYLPTGKFVKYASGEVLEKSSYKFPRFPVVRSTDIDTIGASRGSSFVERIKSHQILINRTITEVWNSLRRSVKGKWLVAGKTVNLRHLHPQSPAAEYYGATPPSYVSFPGINEWAIRFIELIRSYAEKQARIQGIVQGSPPPNVRSGLQFAQLEEMEKRSVEITIGKKIAAIEELGEVVAMIMGANYKPEDQRQITIYGKDKEYLIKSLNVEAVRESHNVRVETDSLPSGTMSQLSFYSELRAQTSPEVVPDELFIDMLDTGRFNEYTEFAGATVETTKSQISKMIAGEKPEAPGAYEDLILKWKIVVGTMRKRAFLSYSEKTRNLFRDFVYTIEEMIINKQNKTQAMEEKIKTLISFPVFYTPPVFEFLEAPAGGTPLPPAAEAGSQAGAAEAAPLLPDGVEELSPEMLAGLEDQLAGM